MHEENFIVANASWKLLIMKMVLSRRCNGSWLLDAAELFGKGVAVCCYLPAFALLPASYAWFIHSALLHLDRHPSKSSKLSSGNLFRHALAKPFDMPRTSNQKWSHTVSFPHAGNLLRKKLQSCNWTHPTNSHLFMRAFCLIIRAIKFTVFFACLVMLATLRSFWVWGLAMEVSLGSYLTPCHPMCTARLQGLNLLDKEGTERGSKVATALHRILWAATGRFGCG